MNRRLSRLQQIYQLKLEATQKAYSELLAAKEQFNTNKARHDQLVIYRQDYVQQLEQLGQSGSSLGRLRNRIDFINHLDTALLQLNAVLAQLAKTRTKMELQYKQAKAAQESICKLIARVQKTTETMLQRSDQKENDESAQKQWYSKNTYD